MVNTCIRFLVVGLALTQISCGSQDGFSGGDAKKNNLPRACIIDLDGTVADEAERRKMCEDETGKLDYEQYFDPEKLDMDKPIENSKETLEFIEQQGIEIIYVSSRPEAMKKASAAWLKRYGFPKATIHHKKEKYQKTVAYKSEIISKIQKTRNVLFGVGDRPTDKQSYRECGIDYFVIAEDDAAGSWDAVKEAVTGKYADKE